MTQKKVVFIGEASLLFAYKGYKWLFEKMGWQIFEVWTIDKAKKIKDISVVVMFAWANRYIPELPLWQNHPPIIWHYIPRFDKLPGIEVTVYDGNRASPREMLEIAEKLILPAEVQEG